MIKMMVLFAATVAIGICVLGTHNTEVTHAIGFAGLLVMLGTLYLQAATNDWTLSQIGLYREGDQIKSKATNRVITYNEVAQIDRMSTPD